MRLDIEDDGEISLVVAVLRIFKGLEYETKSKKKKSFIKLFKCQQCTKHTKTTK